MLYYEINMDNLTGEGTMYAELEMEIEGGLLDYRKSSRLQGVIMEHIDSAYAGRLHESRLNPYSQFFVRKNAQEDEQP